MASENIIFYYKIIFSVSSMSYNSHVCVQTFLKTETVQSSRRLFR